MSDKLLNEVKFKKQLKNCNYEMAKQIFINIFSDGVIPKELASLLDNFVSNPCFETAFDLLKYDLKLINVFELSRKGGFTENLFTKGELNNL